MPFCSPQFDDIERIWTCMLPSYGASHGCGPGCYSCASSASPVSVGTDIHARRWLRFSDKLESRMGNGTWKFPRSGDPQQVVILMPIDSGNMQVASCWRNGGTERFKEGGGLVTICDCAAGDHVCDPGGGFGGFYLQGASENPNLATCWVFAGFGWPPRVFHCTGALTVAGPIPVRFMPPGLWNTALIHLGSHGEDGAASVSNACTCNAAVDAWGFRDEDGCFPGSTGYYNQSLRTAYDFMFVNGLSMTWGGTRPEEELKNKIVELFEADRADNNGFAYGFGQIDSERRLADDLDNKNFALPRYGRTWNVGVIDEHNEIVAFAADTGTIQPFGNDYFGPADPYTRTFSVGVPDRAVTDVTLNFTGLFHRPNPIFNIHVSINGFPFGQAFPDAVSCISGSNTITIDKDFWNDTVMAGTSEIVIVLTAIGFFGDECVDQGLGTEEQARVQMDISYNGEFTFEGPRPFNTLPAVANLTGRFQKTGLTIDAEYVAVDAQLDANLVLHRHNRSPFGQFTVARFFVQPLCSVRFKAHAGIRISDSDLASFNATGHTVNGAALQITTDYPNVLVPIVSGGVDIIHWFDGTGRFVRPPRNMEWHGRYSYLSEPASLGTNQISGCGFLFAASIPADLSHRLEDPGNRKHVWEGSCSLSHSGAGC